MLLSAMYLFLQDFCQTSVQEQVPQFKFYEEIRKYEKLDCDEERRKKAREIYDTFIMRELLSNSNLYSKASAEHVQKQLAVKPTQATEVSMSFLTFLLFSSVIWLSTH